MAQLIQSGNQSSCGLAAGRGDQGFSLLESLIAILVLAITLTGGYALFIHANEIYYRNLRARLAASQADMMMEQIKSAGCTGTPAVANMAVSSGVFSGTLKITWPVSATQDPCVAPVAKPGTCQSPTLVGVCVTDSGTPAMPPVGLVTYVRS